MSRIISVAVREYLATVTTKGFIFGILLMPILMAVVFTLMPLLLNQQSPKVKGTVAVIDRSGAVSSRLEKAFSPEEQEKRRTERVETRNKKLDKAGLPTMGASPEEMAKAQEQAAAMSAPKTEITLQVLAPDADIEKEKQPILDSVGREKDLDSGDKRLALIVIPAESVRGDAAGAFPAFDAFVAPKLDGEVQGDIERQAQSAIVDARLEANQLDIKKVRSLMAAPESKAVAVTKDGDRDTNKIASFLVPMGFMMLLWISVFTAGQYLLTSLIEEKSSRVMELLLSAVSPMQLMVGKIVGQLWVGLTILGLYAGSSLAALFAFQKGHLLDPLMLAYLAVYFMIAFFTVAAMMAAIGSAVSDVREAQSLMGPVMIILMIPMMLWMPIQRNPNSMFAQVCSFLPPISPFVMILRLSGSEKVPVWQVPVSIIIGVGGAVALCWAAAKIFRVGVLMYGKPPSLLGLIKWIRYA
jgi:ABC-2 type transport system permease protein